MINKRTQRSRPIAEINVVPYIDVMLVLLVIFMITAPILTQGVTVDLPKVASDTIKSADREPVIVSVNYGGEFFLNISETPDSPIAAKALMIKVAAELAIAKQNSEKLNVLVKGDKGVPYGKVVEAMSLLKQSGAEQVGLITDSINVDSESMG